MLSEDEHYSGSPQPIYSIGHTGPIGYVYSDGSYRSTIPNPEVSIIVATYGYDEPEWIEGYDGGGFWQDDDEDWLEDHPWEVLAQRAVDSASVQRNDHKVEVVRVYGKNDLCVARNEGARRARGDWLIFLDADDELSPGYVKAMLAAEGDIRKPATLGVVDGVEDDEPVMIPKTDLLKRNHIVIGAMVNKFKFLQAGGFKPGLKALEDWDLWRRMVYFHEASVTEVPDAVYRVHVRGGSRNSNTRNHHDAYKYIQRCFAEEARKRGVAL